MILFCGEALMDMLPDQNSKGDPVLRPVCGGAALNSAIATGRLGQACGMVTGLSVDGFGMQLQSALEAARVDHTSTIRSNRPTTLAVVTLSDGDAVYTFYDEGSAGRMITTADMPTAGKNVAALVFGGISLIPDPCGSAYEAMAERHADTHLIYLDPNIRPGFVSDEAAYRARLERLFACAHIVKISDDDLAWLMPDMSVANGIAALLAKGVQTVLHTKGADGSTAHTTSGSVLAPAPKITVADTVGVGDTFNGAFLTALAHHNALSAGALANLSDETMVEVLSFANRAAAITASRHGANPPTLLELQHA
ncbi:MAG: carbohydrate kinase [Pseudomonadota bacterium]